MISARDALERLQEGNRRFASNTQAGATSADRARRVAEQEPFAIVLGCSDARVPAEIVFDQGLGDLFVIRVAGNIVAASQIGSVEFAAEQFGTPLVVVLGHSRCGAVTATLERTPEAAGQPISQLAVDRRPHPTLGGSAARDRTETRFGRARATRDSKQRPRVGEPLAPRLRGAGRTPEEGIGRGGRGVLARDRDRGVLRGDTAERLNPPTYPRAVRSTPNTPSTRLIDLMTFSRCFMSWISTVMSIRARRSSSVRASMFVMLVLIPDTFALISASIPLRSSTCMVRRTT